MRKKIRYGIFLLLICLSMGTMVSCQKRGTITISWAVYDFPIPADLEEDLNAVLKEKGLPYEVQFSNIEPSEEYVRKYFEEQTIDRKLYMEGCGEALKTGQYDIVGFPALADFYDYYGIFAGEGLLEPLDPYLEEGQPLYGVCPEAFQKVLQVEGKQYGLLNHWGNFKKYLVLNEIYLDKYGIHPGETVTMDEAAWWIRTAAEGEKDEAGFYIGRIGEPFRYEGYEDTLCPMVSVDTAKQELTAVSNLEIPVFLERMRLWNELSDCGINAEIPLNSYKNGTFLMESVYSYSAEAAVNSMYCDMEIDRNIPLRAVECPEGNNPISKWGYVTAISSESRQKQEAAGFLGAVYSDRELSDCLAYGKDPQKEDGRVLQDEGTSLTRKLYFGNHLITSPDRSDSSEKETELKEILDTVPVSGLAGFVFDCSPVEKEMESVLAVYEQTYPVLFGTQEKFETELADFQEKLEEAGLSRIIDEMNRQLQDFQERKGI